MVYDLTAHKTLAKMKALAEPEALCLQKHDMALHVKHSSNCHRAKQN